MKHLIAITSCAADTVNGNNKAIRDTWIQKFRSIAGGKDFNCRFFIGTGKPGPLEDEHPQFQRSYTDIQQRHPHLLTQLPLNPKDLMGDEVLLNIPDTYPYLPYKIRAIRKWAWTEGYEYIFKCDVDTFLKPGKLIDSGYWRKDYVGNGSFLEGPERLEVEGKYAWGGAGYWLSKAAYESTIDCPIDCMFEDAWTGKHLLLNGIHLSLDDRYCFSIGQLDYAISIHLGESTGEYSKDSMYQTSILSDKSSRIKTLAAKRPQRGIRKRL